MRFGKELMKQIKIKLSQIEGHHTNFLTTFQQNTELRSSDRWMFRQKRECVVPVIRFVLSEFRLDSFKENLRWKKNEKISINLFNSHNRFVIFSNNLIVIVTDPADLLR